VNIAVPTLGCDGGLSGISRYTNRILAQLATSPEVGDLEIFSLSGEERFFAPASDRSHTTPVATRYRSPLASILWHQAVLPRVSRRADVLFLPAGNRRLPLYSAIPTVGVVHDLSSLHVPGKYGLTRDAYIKRVLPVLIRRLTQIITVSESSRRDIVTYCGIAPERVTVIPLGVDAEQFAPAPAAGDRARIREQLGVDAPYFLYVSRIEHPGKNHVRLIEAFARSIARTGAPHHLILAGPDRERAAEVHQAAAGSGMRDRIHFTGFLPDDLLPSLYRASAALVFPSLYEGFGLPIVEAMACGVPVACGRISSLPEVAGDAALYFDPQEVEPLAQRLTELVERPELGRELAARSLARSRLFRWSEVARRTLDVMRRAVSPVRPD